ncbi:unnamed protein product [Candidula unifasciata]|uniref:PEHE domain-containing protein n=1 Tax=Candidula unifasciata TaxID=100452 RepID=A0A8S3YZJ1_9EUPU|nr:unnamed protein product [Candidula unifasciata]
MELSLAIQESLKYAQQEKEDELKENGYCESNGPKVKDSENRCDSSSDACSKSEQSQVTNKAVHSPSSSAAMASSNCWAGEEMGRLKDLLMSQAEFIQCQQNEIMEKDREIKALMSARDALQCRLERMERRMSILKHKEEMRDYSGATLLETVAKAATPSLIVQQKGSSDATITELKKFPRRGYKQSISQRKHPYKRQKLAKQQNSVAESDKEESENEEKEEESSTESGLAEEEGNQSDIENSGNQEEASDQPETHLEQEERTIDYPTMQTETLYHLYYPKTFCPSPDPKILQEQSDVETPSWRLRPMTNMYQLEGTENITDEAYFKRHQKYELEEKRRKRWDLQRLRELRLSEKLQRQREDEIRASQDEADVETFLPSVHDIKYIEKTDLIPVMAFGQPVPYVSPAEFEIPWEITNPGPVTPAGRQRCNSVHSKKL